MATSSANDIMGRALVKARVFAPGDSIPAAISTQVFAELNDMLESWALENLMVYVDVLESFALVASQGEYTYGTGGDFDSDRPLRIRDECFIRSGDSDYAVRLKDLDVYRSIVNKSTGARPRVISFLPEYPLAKVFLWPKPANTDALHLRVWKQLVAFADKTTGVNLPPGYQRAIVANLAVELSPNFGKRVSTELAFLASQSKMTIKRANSFPIKSLKTELAAMTGRSHTPHFNSGPFA